jgi:hypothetical protein
MHVPSVEVQICSSIIKIKQLWDDVKDAPGEIRDLLEDIDILSKVLSDFETHDDLPPAAARNLDLCSRGARLLTEVLNELDTKVRKRKRIGGLKAVLERGTVENLKKKLRSGQTMLALAYQIYLKYIL